MSDIKNGGPAFPQGKAVGSVSLLEGGMTLRDYFAAKAVEGTLANSAFHDDNPDALAEWAYKMADAMLKERNK